MSSIISTAVSSAGASTSATAAESATATGKRSVDAATAGAGVAAAEEKNNGTIATNTPRSSLLTAAVSIPATAVASTDVSTASADGMDEEKENNGAKLEKGSTGHLPSSKRQKKNVVRLGFPVTPAQPNHPPSSSPMTVSTDDSNPLSTSSKEDSPCNALENKGGVNNTTYRDCIPPSFQLLSPEQSKERMFGEDAEELEFDASFVIDMIKSRDLELSYTTFMEGICPKEFMDQLYDLCVEHHLLLEVIGARNTFYNGGPSMFRHVMDTLRKNDLIDSLLKKLSKVVDIKGCYTGAYGEELFGKDAVEDASEDMEEDESDVDIDQGVQHQDNGDEDENDVDIAEGGGRTPLHQDKEGGGGFIPLHQDRRYGAYGDATHRILFNVGCLEKELWFKKGKKVCGLRITHGSVVSMSEKAGGVTGDIYHAATKAPKSWIIVVEVAKKN